MRDHNNIFTGSDWHSVDRHQRSELRKEIEAMDGDRLLNTSVDDLAHYFEKKFQIEVPTLLTEEIVVDQREMQIDVSRDPMRIIHDKSRPFNITGTEIEVEIPFQGEAEAFQIKPNPYTLNPPRAEIRGNTLAIRISGLDLKPENVKQEIDRSIASIESYLKNLRGNVVGLNNQLFAEAKSAIEQRRQKLLANRNLVSALGYKMKECEGAARTYTAPEVRRRLSPVLPPASSSPYKPEPVLSQDDYEHILGILENMAHVMERSPSAFQTMDEESLRTHFLVQLNGHYEGQATGETFNYQGKTDILIRSEGKNIFIAECKYWSGPKKLAETIDQLLGYGSWRDTKMAIILFNRNKNFSKVLEAIPEAVRAHPNYKRDMPGSTETRFRYCFAHRDDANRELILSILAFDVPS